MPRATQPPFDQATAVQKVRMAEDAWSTKDPGKVAMAYTHDSVWRSRELDYRLIKELWAFTSNRIDVRFVYEWRNDSNQWFRSYGNENCEFEKTA